MKNSSRERAFETLADAWRRGQLAQSIILSGPMGAIDRWAESIERLLLCEREGDEGCGCRSCRAGLLQHPDRVMLEPSPKTIRRDDTEQALSLLASRPLWAPAKVVVIRPADTLGREAESYLLKHLEEPRDYVYYLLLTEVPEAIMGTIRSRCQHWRFSRVEASGGETIAAIQQLLQSAPSLDSVVTMTYWVREQFLQSQDARWLAAWDVLQQAYHDLERNGNPDLALARIRRAIPQGGSL